MDFDVKANALGLVHNIFQVRIWGFLFGTKHCHLMREYQKDELNVKCSSHCAKEKEHRMV